MNRWETTCTALPVSGQIMVDVAELFLILSPLNCHFRCNISPNAFPLHESFQRGPSALRQWQRCSASRTVFDGIFLAQSICLNLRSADSVYF